MSDWNNLSDEVTGVESVGKLKGRLESARLFVSEGDKGSFGLNIVGMRVRIMQDSQLHHRN